MALVRSGAAAAIAWILVGCAGAPAVRDVSAPAPLASPVEAAAPAARAAAPPAGPGTGLVLLVDPSDAEIAIDGRPQGVASDLGAAGLLPLQPGIYQVTVTRRGYAPWRAEVAVRSEPQRFNIVLERR